MLQIVTVISKIVSDIIHSRTVLYKRVSDIMLQIVTVLFEIVSDICYIL